jgi:hypothetical protein
MKNLQLVLLFLCCNSIFAHTINYENQVLKHWNIQKENKFVDGSFSMLKNGKVYIEEGNNTIVNFPITDLSIEDQTYAQQREAKVEAINTTFNNSNSDVNQTILKYKFMFIAFMLLLITNKNMQFQSFFVEP